MSAFSGAQGKGAMRRRRDKKRTEAEARNAVEVRVYKCGHVSSRFDHPCWQAAS